MGHLRQRLVAGNGLDLVAAAAGIGEPRRRRLAQAVSRAKGQPGGPALLLEPVAEAVGREGGLALCGQEQKPRRSVAARIVFSSG